MRLRRRTPAREPPRTHSLKRCRTRLVRTQRRSTSSRRAPRPEVPQSIERSAQVPWLPAPASPTGSSIAPRGALSQGSHHLLRSPGRATSSSEDGDRIGTRLASRPGRTATGLRSPNTRPRRQPAGDPPATPAGAEGPLTTPSIVTLPCPSGRRHGCPRQHEARDERVPVATQSDRPVRPIGEQAARRVRVSTRTAAGERSEATTGVARTAPCRLRPAPPDEEPVFHLCNVAAQTNVNKAGRRSSSHVSQEVKTFATDATNP